MAKLFPCPYCGQRFGRDKLDHHIDKEHDDELPDNMTAYQIAYDIINNHPNHKGSCVVCHSPTNWNEKTQKYFRICKNPKCAKEIREVYKTRMLKTYNKIHLLDDPEHQKKMLAHRRISGTYVWSDGKEFTYTGSYEKKFLEFLDKVMNFDSSDVITPGPTIEYEYKGKKLKWITDCLILSLSLIVEIKDGGDNPNKRFMPDYRAKQVSKEKMITNMGTYSYLRLTNNNFAQLLSILAELKMKVVEDDTGPVFRINESTYVPIFDKETVIREETLLSDIESTLLENAKNLDQGFISLTETGRYLDDPENQGQQYYEAFTIIPTFCHKKILPLFENVVKGCLEICEQTSPYPIHYRWLNPFNHSEGVSIGLRTFE